MKSKLNIILNSLITLVFIKNQFGRERANYIFGSGIDKIVFGINIK